MCDARETKVDRLIRAMDRLATTLNTQAIVRENAQFAAACKDASQPPRYLDYRLSLKEAAVIDAMRRAS